MGVVTVVCSPQCQYNNNNNNIRLRMIQGGGGGGYPSSKSISKSISKSKSMELRWISRRNPKSREREFEFGGLKPKLMPIYISTDPSHINLDELSQVYRSCNHSCHRFPALDPNTAGGMVVEEKEEEEAIDLDKLRTALSHSCAVVSVFCKPEQKNKNKGDGGLGFLRLGLGGGSAGGVTPSPSPSNAQLVGFGRAVSDLGLTASIYDVMVIPSLQGMGIGTIIVKRIVRMLTSRDIYDIAALCSRKERFFFKACGFRDDILGSTTMMYTRTVSTSPEGDHISTSPEVDQMVTRAGRKLLLAPPLREPFASSTTSKPQS